MSTKTEQVLAENTVKRLGGGSKSKVWGGTFERVGVVKIERRPGRMHSGFFGKATVYKFIADNPRCKVTFAAVITGVRKEVLIVDSGAVGAAVLRAARLERYAKNSSVAGDYDTFPEPIGCPVDKLQAAPSTGYNGEHVLTFYAKASKAVRRAPVVAQPAVIADRLLVELCHTFRLEADALEEQYAWPPKTPSGEALEGAQHLHEEANKIAARVQNQELRPFQAFDESCAPYLEMARGKP